MVLSSLLASADPGAIENLSRILKELDIDAEPCPDLREVWKNAGGTRYDAIIVDCDDPGLSGEIVRKIRASSLNGNSLIIALLSGQERVREVFAWGANFVLYKPISLERARNSLRAARGLMRRERRRSSRVPVRVTAGIGYGSVENAPATILDISEDGTSIQFEGKMPPVGKIYFQFKLPGHTDCVRFSAEVVWQDPAGRVGVRFADVPQSSRRLIKTWLRHNFYRHSQPGQIENPKVPDLAEGAPANTTPPKPLIPSGSADDGLVRFRAAPGNRRTESRHACRLGAEVYRLGTHVPNRCSLSDISEGGCYVEMPTPFASEDGVEIVVRTQDLKFRTRGVVQSCHPGFGMGVRFNPRNDAEREEILQLIALLDRQRTLQEKF